jgi:predicted transcriptional regulator
MHTEVLLIATNASVAEAWQQVSHDEAPAYLVGTRDRLVGRIARERLAAAALSGAGAQPVRALLEDTHVHVHPDHPIDVVLDRYDQSEGLLPVVSRADVGRLEGVITLDSIVRILDRQRQIPRRSS